MKDQLPIISSEKNISTVKSSTTTLLGRGLAAIQQKQIMVTEHNENYRNARDAFDRITAYSNLNSKLWDECKLKTLRECYNTFKELAIIGYEKAYFPLARIYLGWKGLDEESRLVLALIHRKRLYRMNIDIEGENQQADLLLGRYYATLAFNWCVESQAVHDPEIWCDLGTLYRCGIGVESDKTLGFFWYQKSAEAGHIGGQYFLGRLYSSEWWLGVDRDLSKALFWYRKAADQGFIWAQMHLAYFYDAEKGVQQDYSQAAHWYRKAAEQEDATAQFHLARVYENGLGIEQDYNAAVFWYKNAAEQGNAKAQFNIGNMLFAGRGLGQDVDEALFWYKKAAIQGHFDSQQKLAEHGIEWVMK
ncbi:MAG: tetratricopeptide repeat protein [Methylococcales bacterium]|nr:tetratricopeptide repeat protein [Methylococcales bacterium]